MNPVEKYFFHYLIMYDDDDDDGNDDNNNNDVLQADVAFVNVLNNEKC